MPAQARGQLHGLSDDAGIQLALVDPPGELCRKAAGEPHQQSGMGRAQGCQRRRQGAGEYRGDGAQLQHAGNVGARQRVLEIGAQAHYLPGSLHQVGAVGIQQRRAPAAVEQ